MKKFTRREFNRIAGTFSVNMALGGLVRAESSLKKTNRPNILFIMTDQQSAQMMSCTGNRWLKTPAIDRLAASGARFERAYASNPVCVPSRFSLQTGLMPSAIGMGRNEDSKLSTVTDCMIKNSLGNLFRNAGYDTVYGGKLHLPERMNDLSVLGYRNLTTDSRQHLAEECVKYLLKKHDKPFFLFASFINPHDICYMAINDYRRAKGEAPHDNIDSRTCETVLDQVRRQSDMNTFINKHCPDLPANHDIPDNEPACITQKYTQARPFRDYIRRNWEAEKWRLHRWAYCRLTEMVDAKIDLLLQALHESGLEENTLVVFTSDHGDMDSAHKLEHKSVLYEEAVRIPFIMSYKGIIPAGTVDNTHFISNGLDLLPTLCDYAGIDAPQGLSGTSIKPLAERKAEPAWRDHLVVESQNGRMVRTGRYKYAVYDSGNYRRQLFDVRTDAGEMKNLAEIPAYKDIADQHHQLLKDWIGRNRDSIGADYI